MLSIAGRSGHGQEFELEFDGYFAGVGISFRIPPSKALANLSSFPYDKRSSAFIRWTEHNGEYRLLIDIPGNPRLPYDEAPDGLRKFLYRFVERFAAELRRLQKRD